MMDSRFPKGTLDTRLAVAFRGLELDGYDAEETMCCLYEDDTVTWTAPFVATLAERILELSAIVAQNALVADPSAEAERDVMIEGWTPPPKPELSAVRKEQLAEARARATKQEGSLL